MSKERTAPRPGGDQEEELRYRPATQADVPAVVELVNSAYRGDSSRQGWTTEADLVGGQRVDPEGIGELLAKPRTLILLVENDDTLLACCELHRSGGGDAYFGMFSVRPTAQGNGLGRRVLNEAERLSAEEWGCRRMRMTVIHQRDDLIAYYERRGYKRTGVFSPFPYGDERFGQPKRPDLAFEELVKTLDARDAD